MIYVLITPARNEAALIGKTIQAVVHQTIRPARWVIVSDGSTDGTDDIVKKYAQVHPWIELLRMPDRAQRDFGGKAIAFNLGWNTVKNTTYDIIGNLDADISFDEDYFAFLLGKFAQDETLGVAGTPFREGDKQYNYRFSRKEHVSGACQLFRRECFDMVGGYIPRKGGGVDLIAVVTARMKGWKTETFTEKVCYHLRPMGAAGPNFLEYCFKSGHGDYLLGVHPLWQFLRSIYQMKADPNAAAGLLLLCGYVWGMITRAPKPVSKDFVRFRRAEQMSWLKGYCQKALAYLD